MSKEEIKVFKESEINDILDKEFDDWTYDGKWIRKKYKTSSWKGTLMVINTIGHLAEAAWHHPDLIASYFKVVLFLSAVFAILAALS